MAKTVSKDYYRTLGLSPDASTREIKKRYRELAMKFHPDRNPDDQEAAERFREITEAYGVLVDESRRRAYDARAQGAFDRAAVFEDIFANKDFREVFEGLPISRAWLERILWAGRIVAYEAIVVGGSPSAVLKRSAARLASQGARRMFHAVMDMHERLVLPVADAGQGRTVTLEYRQGFTVRRIRVKIPPNTGQGTVLRIRGMGRRGPLGKAGDLYLHVSIDGS